MKKPLPILAVACLLTIPTAAAAVPMFGPGQPILPAGSGYIPSGPQTTVLSDGKLLSIDEIENMVKNHNLQLQALEESIRGLEDTDDVWPLYNQQAQELYKLAQDFGTMLEATEDATIKALLTVNQSMLKSQADNLLSQARSTDEQIEEQLDNLEKQLDDTGDQLAFAAESAFIAVKSMEGNYADLIRQQTVQKNALREMEKRYEMGQVSALELERAKNGLLQLETNILTLTMNIENTKTDLNLLLGRKAESSFSLAPLPVIADSQIAAVSYDRGLPEVRRRSTEIRDAAEACDDAEEQDNRHAENAAWLQYTSTVNTVSQNFQKLCSAVTDQQRLVTAAQSAYVLEQKTLQVQETKYKNGQISLDDYYAAQAALETAANAVTTAQNNLYTAYMKYEWAMKGVIASS